MDVTLGSNKAKEESHLREEKGGEYPSARQQMVYGSQADVAGNQRLPSEIVTMTAGFATCGYDPEWAKLLVSPVVPRE